MLISAENLKHPFKGCFFAKVWAHVSQECRIPFKKGISKNGNSHVIGLSTACPPNKEILPNKVISTF
jgi:hypothetical protein